MSKLRIHTDLNIAQTEISQGRGVYFAAPFMEENQRIQNSSLDSFDSWNKIAKHKISVVDDPTDCDFLLFPYDYTRKLHEKRLKLRDWLTKASSVGKKLLVFSQSDDAPQENSDSLVSLSMSIYRTIASTSRTHHLAIPVMINLSQDKSHCNRLDLRRWTPAPSIGFCGMAAKSSLKSGLKYRLEILKLRREFGGHAVNHIKGKYLRTHVMRILERESKSRYKCNFRSRSLWYNANDVPDAQVDFREEFLNNVIDNDYTLCVRGGGNYSIRFFECVRLGRIPLFLDTDCMLPLDSKIRYDEIMPVIPATDMRFAPEILMTFHSKHQRDFQDIQEQWKNIARTHFSPSGFFSALIESLQRIEHPL